MGLYPADSVAGLGTELEDALSGLPRGNAFRSANDDIADDPFFGGSGREGCSFC